MTAIDTKLLLCEPFRVSDKDDISVLTLGAELKSSVCLIKNGFAYLSKSIGNLGEPDNYRQFIKTAETFNTAVQNQPDLLVYDMHPGYLATNYAKKQGGRKLAVQHHHAHIAACAAENSIDGRIIGIAADGTGYGTDGAVWGCEILQTDGKNFSRLGHLRYFKLFGGDLASIETWRPAAGLLNETFGSDWQMDGIDSETIEIAKKRLTGRANLPKTSSLGRLFDGIAFLLGICGKNQQEAQAAIALENAAGRAGKCSAFKYKLTKTDDGCIEMDYRPMIAELVECTDNGIDKAVLAGRFHETVAVMLVECVKLVAEQANIKNIILSGGCFLNKILSARVGELGRKSGLNIVFHKKTSPGDGCIALGQAIIGLNQI